MAEPACVLQLHRPFSPTSPLHSHDSIPSEGSSVQAALGQSVSFGRFMTETLAWEKWSTFSQNRYVEEAERYSKPGSVAQKKAFFEAHYKNLAAKKAAEAAAAAAAAQLERERSEAWSLVGEVDNGDPLVVKEELKETERVMVEKTDSKRDLDPVSVKRSTSKKKRVDNALAKLAIPSKAPTKSAPVNATPIVKKSVLASAEKKRATPRSLHMAVNFSPIREISKLKSTVIRRIDNSRFGTKPSRDCPTPLKTPVKVLKNQPLEPPCSMNRRVTTSASASKPTGPKWRSIATEKKTCSPFSSTPFSFRTEDRATKRKEKLEEKFNANETREESSKIKAKEKAEAYTEKSRQGSCFKARPLPDFYRQRKAENDEAKKVPTTHPETSKPGNIKEVTPSKVEMKSSKTLKKPKAKNNARPACSLISRPKRTTTITHENTSPNIQYT